MTNLRAADLWGEAVNGLLVRPLRTVLTILGVAVGVCALVTTLGISRTAGHQILDRIDIFEATTISVEAPATDDELDAATPMRWNVETQVDRLNGVVASGGYAPVNLRADLVSAAPIYDPVSVTQFALPTFGVSPGLLAAADGQMLAGRFLDPGDDERAARVVVLGAAAAEELHIWRVDNRPAIFIGDDLYTVVGILADAPRVPTLVNSVMLPAGTAAERYRVTGPTSVLVDTEVGATQLIARQAATALVPENPRAVAVVAPPDPKEIRQGLTADVNGLFVVLGLLTVAVGAIGIANTSLVAVLERTGEIGLRRALGATRLDIALQVLGETGVIGLIAGICGTTAGILIIVAVSNLRGWTPVLDPWTFVAAPLGACAVAMIAGFSPARRATNIDPVDALRWS